MEAAQLMSAAEKATDLSDWGEDRTFRVGLEKLLSAVEAMDCAGRLREPVAQQAVQLLSTRLRLEDDARRYPEILRGRIEKPLIVTGLPRTGTTWLYELLALDPAARAPLDWEVQAPWPAPETANHDSDPRIAQIQAGYEAMLKTTPELATMHNFHAQAPQECNGITQLHFASSNFWAAYAVPNYIDWLTFERPEGIFNTHRRVLQQLQWKGPRGRWLLKSPPHLLLIDDILAAYPDACFIQTHREPTRIVASLASMLRAIRKARFGDIGELMEPKEIARSVLRHFGEALERCTKSRENPDVDRRFIDIAYRDTRDDPLSVLRRIYHHFDLPFTSAYEERLKVFLAKPQPRGHGAHKYSMEEFGIAALDLPNQFPGYRRRFSGLLSDG